MKVLLDIQDDKASALMEVLNSLPFVKTEELSAEKETFLKEFKQAIEEVKLAREGKLTLKTLDELIDEL